MFYCNLDPARKNFLVVTPAQGGRVQITHEPLTDAEIAERVDDYFNENKLDSIEVGESFTTSDGSQIILRIL